MDKFLLMDKWSEAWKEDHNETHKKMNVIIEMFNKWQYDGFDPKRATVLLNEIRKGKIYITGGGSGVIADLEKMELHIEWLGIKPIYPPQ